MERGRVRIAPYVRREVRMRYTADNPPPLEPPAELAGAVNPGVWRVAARWWRDHQPDEGGRVCRACFRLYPCPGVLGADGILDTFWRRAAARGRATVLALYPRNRRI